MDGFSAQMGDSEVPGEGRRAPDGLEPGSAATAGSSARGELALLTAALLAADGLRVTGPDPEEAGGCVLWVACQDAQYSLYVDDFGVELARERHPCSDDPRRVAAVAAALLSAGPAAPGAAPEPDPGEEEDRPLTFKGIAGADLRARGFDAQLEVYADDALLDVFAQVTVTAPGSGAGTVCLRDDEGMGWSYDPRPAPAPPHPKTRAPLPDRPATARAIATAVTRALGTASGTLAQSAA